eukprot:9455199-Pyramimonas_sp.AAC.1
MAAHLGTPLTRFVASWGAPPDAPVEGSAWPSRPMSAHPLCGSWPRRELHLRPKWQGPHGGPAL